MPAVARTATPAGAKKGEAEPSASSSVRLTAAEREESGLRMIGSLGRDRAEASGELAAAGQPRPLRSETARELVTILPRRITREVPILTQELADSLPKPKPTSPVLAPKPTPVSTPAVEPATAAAAATQRVLPGSGVRAPGLSDRLLRAAGSRGKGPGTAAIVLLVVAAVLAGTAIVLRMRRQEPDGPGVKSGSAEVAGPGSGAESSTNGSAAHDDGARTDGVASPREGSGPSGSASSGTMAGGDGTSGRASDGSSKTTGSGSSSKTGDGKAGDGSSPALEKTVDGKRVDAIGKTAAGDGKVGGDAKAAGDGKVVGSGKLVDADGKVAAGDGKVAAGDGKAAAGDGKAASGDGKAAAGDGKAAAGDGKAAAGDGKAGDGKAGDAGDKSAGAKAMYDKAHDAMDESNFTQALQYADASLKLRKTARTYLLRAQAQQRLEQIDAALASVDAASAISPTMAAVWETRGRILWAARRRDEARAAFEKFLALEPDSPKAASVRRLISEPR